MSSLVLQVIGMGEKWEGGDMNYPGGGFKVNLLKKELEEYKDNDNLLILFTDSYDVIVSGDKAEFLEKFKSFGAKIVFGAEDFCWPDAGLTDKYPEVSGKKTTMRRLREVQKSSA